MKMLALKGVHLSGLTFSITPDEALVETRRKLVIKRKNLVLFREN